MHCRVREIYVPSFTLMQKHGPKRVYTPQSLEFWFEKLSLDWENHFNANQLEEGHRLYRDGEVRELELTTEERKPIGDFYFYRSAPCFMC